MVDNNYTHISVVLDRSGSMRSIKSDTEGGFNSFLAEQKKVPGKATISLAQFDSQYDVVYSSLDIKDAPDLVLTPRGNTALLDAIGKTIVSTGEFLAAMDEDKRPGNVLLVIITDGEENSSKEWTLDAVKELITKQTNEFSWTFHFLSSGLDAIGTGTSLGIRNNTAFTNDSHSVGASYAAMTRSTTQYRGGQNYNAPSKV